MLRNRSRIDLEIQGGLGNQLFQLCAALLIRNETGGTIKVNKKSYFDPRMRNYELSPFETILKFKSNKFRFKFSKSQSYLEQQEFVYDSPPRFVTGNIRIRGYFQNPTYVEKVRNELDKALVRIVRETKVFAHCSCPKIHVAVHVRRGDYIAIPVNVINFGVLTDKYFARGMQKYPADESHFIIFSDSPLEIRSIIQLLPDSNIDIFLEKATNLETMIAISRFSNIVISNSSFSWWAAYISQLIHNEPRIISPNTWFRKIPSSKSLINGNWELQEPEWL